jgi:Ser/Thr protein kinase RdoA (MazF antagonist)
MKDYASNEEFFGDLRVLVERWCDERKLSALSRLLPGYLSHNGLTDGWANLLEGLQSARALGHAAFSARDWDALNDLIHASEAAVYRCR